MTEDLLKRAYWYAHKWRGTIDVDDAAQMCVEEMLKTSTPKAYSKACRRRLHREKRTLPVMHVGGAVWRESPTYLTRVGDQNIGELSVDGQQEAKLLVAELANYAERNGLTAVLKALRTGEGLSPRSAQPEGHGRRAKRLKREIQELRERFGQ